MNCMTKPYARNLQNWLHHEGETTPTRALTGRLVAPQISGLSYRCATQRGLTNRLGEFQYQQNESVTFLIGACELPVARPGSTVTPYDMGTTAHEPLNVIRLLHLLCVESKGGLTISTSLARWINGPINFATEHEKFIRQPVVVNLIKQSGRGLVDEKIVYAWHDTMITNYMLGRCRDSC